MKITKGTVVRTVATTIVVVNMILKATGKNLINFDESVAYSAIETVVSIAIIAIGFWKNNSFSSNAQKADKYLEELRKFNEEE